jgi:hypothetical protein
MIKAELEFPFSVAYLALERLLILRSANKRRFRNATSKKPKG